MGLSLALVKADKQLVKSLDHLPHPGIVAIEDHSTCRLCFKCVCIPGLERC